MLGILSYDLAIFFFTIAALFAYLKLSHKFHWFDQPDTSRKFHSSVKPTSAGLIFILPIVLMFFSITVNNNINSKLIAVSLLVLMILGGYDDFKPLSARFRLLILLIVSSYFIFSIFTAGQFNFILLFVYLLGLVWWLNLYNFMDGADGMAMLHAIVTLVGYAILYISSDSSSTEMYHYFSLCLVCLLAFLLFNFPKARMFMGDAGSLSLAFLLAAYALYGISSGIFDEVVVISFHLVFIIDATFTLFARLYFKHEISQAHNLHLYQALIKSGKSHASISIAYAFVTLLFVTIAVIMQIQDVKLVFRIIILLIEIFVLSFFWFKFHNKTKFKQFAK